MCVHRRAHVVCSTTPGTRRGPAGAGHRACELRACALNAARVCHTQPREPEPQRSEPQPEPELEPNACGWRGGSKGAESRALRLPPTNSEDMVSLWWLLRRCPVVLWCCCCAGSRLPSKSKSLLAAGQLIFRGTTSTRQSGITSATAGAPELAARGCALPAHAVASGPRLRREGSNHGVRNAHPRAPAARTAPAATPDAP